jgi:hypothetical protein
MILDEPPAAAQLWENPIFLILFNVLSFIIVYFIYRLINHGGKFKLPTYEEQARDLVDLGAAD